jgi:hypothetical protein
MRMDDASERDRLDTIAAGGNTARNGSPASLEHRVQADFLHPDSARRRLLTLDHVRREGAFAAATPQHTRQQGEADAADGPRRR